MNNQVRHFLKLVVGNVLKIPLVILVLSLMSRLIGPVGLGQWSMLVAVSSFFHSFFLNWTQAPSVRFGCEEWLDSKKLSNTWAARFPLILLGFALAILFLTLQPFAFFEKLTSLPSTWWPLVVIYLLGLWWRAEVESLLTITKKYTHLAVSPLLVNGVVVLFLFF